MNSFARPMRAATLAASVFVTALPAISTQAATPAAAAATGQQAAELKAEQKVDQLAARFYDIRARFDPLLYATANGDSRYDDQLGMAIAPKVRARYLADNHKLLRQLQAIAPARLSPQARLNYDILAFEIRSQLDLERFPSTCCR
jgi:uncharacterized protein (DUF885 family)